MDVDTTRHTFSKLLVSAFGSGNSVRALMLRFLVMRRLDQQQRGWLGLFVLWAMVSLACGMPVNQPPSSGLKIPTKAVIIVETDATVTPEVTLPPATPLTTADSATPTPLPTKDVAPSSNDDFVFAPTATPYAGELPDLADLTATPDGLAIEYAIVWRLDQDTNFALADVSLEVTGGEEPFTYYRDNVKMGGATFSYRWGSCKDNPGRFKVVDADGQTVEIDYFEKTPCPANLNQ